MALRWCAVRETRLDTARIRAAHRVIDPVRGTEVGNVGQALAWSGRGQGSTNTIADGVASRHVVTIVCGSNVDMDAYHRWVATAPAR
jgi:hypothetical protein